MFEQLTVGTVVVSLTVIVEAIFVSAAISVMRRSRSWLVQPPHGLKNVFVLVTVTLWLMSALTAGVWIWAAAFIAVDAFQSLELALYFSVTSFTTLGFGDITLTEQWRLLAGICAANGLLLFGLSTAFMVEIMIDLRRAQSDDTQSGDQMD
jgi:hypothetical protein